MLYQEEGTFKLAPLVAKYEQNGEKYEKHILKTNEITPYEKIGHISNLEIEEAEYSRGQIKRLKEIQELTGLTLAIAEPYVMNGEVDKGSILELVKESENLEATMLEISAILGEMIP